MIRTHNKLSRPRRAVILVIVLWIVVVLTVIAYSLTYEMRVSMKMTGHSIKQVKARGLARAGLAQAVNDLRNDRLLIAASGGAAYTDTPLNIYRRDEDKNGTDVELGEGTYTVRVRDLDGRLDLANLRPDNYFMLQYLLEEVCDIKKDDAEGIAKMVLDSIDEDSDSFEVANESESEYWTEWGNKSMKRRRLREWEFRPKNERLFSLDELLAFPGITREMLYGDPEEMPTDPLKRIDNKKESSALADYITVSGDQETTLNINTCSARVLAAVLFAGAGGQGDPMSIAEDIIKKRDDALTETKAEQVGFVAIQDLVAAGLGEEVVTRLNQIVRLEFRSRNFEITSRGNFQGVRETLQAIVNVTMETYQIDPRQPDTFGSRDPRAMGELSTRTDMRVDPAVRVSRFMEL